MYTTYQNVQTSHHIAHSTVESSVINDQSRGANDQPALPPALSEFSLALKLQQPPPSSPQLTHTLHFTHDLPSIADSQHHSTPSLPSHLLPNHHLRVTGSPQALCHTAIVTSAAARQESWSSKGDSTARELPQCRAETFEGKSLPCSSHSLAGLAHTANALCRFSYLEVSRFSRGCRRASRKSFVNELRWN